MTTKNSSNEAVLGEQTKMSAAEEPKRALKLGGYPLAILASQKATETNQRPAVGRPATSKSEIVVSKLRTAKGAAIETLMTATGWQAHSVRGFLSRTVRKKLGLPLESEIGKDGQRRYQLAK